MNNIFFIKQLKGLSNQELALYLISVSIFLPFYLFLTLFISYFILLMVTGKLTTILKSITNQPFLLGFIGYSAVLSIIASNWIGLVVTVFFFLYFIFFKYYQKIITPNLFHMIIQTLIVFSLFALAFAFLEHYMLVNKFDYSFISPTLQRIHQNRAEATFFNPNYYGLVCCFCIMLAMYFFFVTKNWKWKIICFIAIISNSVGLNLSQSRTAFPALILGAIVYLFATIKNSKAFLISLAVFAFAIWLLFSSNLGMRMGSLEEALDDRVLIWTSALEMLSKNMWYGKGPLTYLHEYQSIGAPYHEHAHSLYIDTLLSYGYIGLSLVLASLVNPIRQVIRLSGDFSKRPIVGLILSFFVVVAVHGIFDIAILWIQTAFIFFLVITTLPIWGKADKITYPLDNFE
ncbi:O-antigen ligase family protein [Granulicatella seriolae]|uniref:O-antigen ligase family protein n=1 Tax=Granulicatella seriolae TaxID=2967226 RepID=A0ABT1WN68_9LACT|nr:O-antigen ligase family protein [Granulicatella seriolae]